MQKLLTFFSAKYIRILYIESAKIQFLLFSTIFRYLLLDFHVKTGTRFSLRDEQLIEISEVEITRVDCSKCKTCMYILNGSALDKYKFCQGVIRTVTPSNDYRYYYQEHT